MMVPPRADTPAKAPHGFGEHATAQDQGLRCRAKLSERRNAARELAAARARPTVDDSTKLAEVNHLGRRVPPRENLSNPYTRMLATMDHTKGSGTPEDEKRRVQTYMQRERAVAMHRWGDPELHVPEKSFVL